MEISKRSIQNLIKGRGLPNLKTILELSTPAEKQLIMKIVDQIKERNKSLCQDSRQMIKL